MQEQLEQALAVFIRNLAELAWVFSLHASSENCPSAVRAPLTAHALFVLDVFWMSFALDALHARVCFSTFRVAGHEIL